MNKTRARMMRAKQLTESDIEQMLGDEFIADDKSTRRSLKLNLRMPEDAPAPDRVTLDLHQNTEEQAWEKLTALVHSGTRFAVVITGASGILKIKFQDWMSRSILAPHIHAWRPLNNGSFEIQIKKKRHS
jgi:DNA-nicking Smr family endonuclease